MKRVTISLIAIVITVMTAVAVAQRENGSFILFTDETGHESVISVPVLGEIIAYCDTVSDEREYDIFMSHIYKGMIKQEKNLNKVTILIPDDDYFDLIFIQEDIEGEFLSIKILTKDGWLIAKNRPYCREFMDLASITCMVQHIIEISGP